MLHWVGIPSVARLTQKSRGAKIPPLLDSDCPYPRR